MAGKHISVWFFIGVMLVVYGVLITASGVYDLLNPPAHQPVLANLHSGVWWGAFILVLGVVYTFAFSPRKR
ncbi:MAG TPA: hypothetical protein VKU01_10110 [Bryobacteraceae bacterium]|nr:hypothetical protein [Bryobacteraceae bacterium]